MKAIGKRSVDRGLKLIGVRNTSGLKQMGTRAVLHALKNAVQVNNNTNKIENDHNNEDVQNEPKFQHTEPERKSKNSLEK